MLALLVEFGADLNARDGLWNGPPADWATYGNRNQARDWLVEHG